MITGPTTTDPNVIFLYAIRDNVAGLVGPVFQSVNSQVALRQYSQFLTTQGEGFCPDDFDLLYLGHKSVTTGTIVPIASPEVIRANLELITGD